MSKFSTAQDAQENVKNVSQSTNGTKELRPPFAKHFPKDSELDQILHAFCIGNHAFVREHAPKLAARTTDSQVANAALELRRRIEPDRVSIVLFAGAFALLIALFIWGHRETMHHQQSRSTQAPGASTSQSAPLKLRLSPSVIKALTKPVNPAGSVSTSKH